MAADLVDPPPVGPEWTYEVKLDGSPDKTIVMST
jgi:hypothetical protein